jgi:hypothetical protein
MAQHRLGRTRCVRLDAHTTKNGEARSFPFTTDIETILKGQLAEHERLKEAGTICPFVFQRNGERIVTFRTAWKNACKAAGCPGKLIHDMRRSAVRTFERAGIPRSVAMSIVGHKTSRFTDATRSWTKPCSAKPPPVSTCSSERPRLRRRLPPFRPSGQSRPARQRDGGRPKMQHLRDCNS